MTERQQKLLTIWLASLSGAIIGAGFKDYQWKKHFQKYNENTMGRLGLIGGAYREIADVMEDVTKSGEEREQLIEEKAAFIEMVIRQPIV